MLPFAALLVLGSAGSAAPVGFDGTSIYTQDFQSMTGGAIATSSFAVSTMTEVTTLSGGSAGVQGWYIYGLGWTGAATKWQGADTGASSTGGFRQLYTAGTGARALGSTGSGSAFGFFGLVLQNTSGATINALALSYDAVMNRNPSTTANQYGFAYLVSSAAVSTSTTAGAAGTFGALPQTSASLGFSTPPVGGGTGAPGTAAAIPMHTITSVSGNLANLGWGAGEYLYLAWKEQDEGGSDATAGIDNFSLRALGALRDLTWNLGGNGTWDSSAANFISGGSATAFAATDNVIFGDVAGGVITLSGALAPTSVTVSAASGTFTFAGPTSADKITGTTGITKSGGGTLALTSANDFTGGVTITAGTVSVDGAGRLGNGAISLNGAGATLLNVGASAVVMSANAVVVGANGGTIDAGAAGLTLGALTSSGLLTKAGAGSLTVGTVTSSVGSGFVVGAGDLVLGQAAGVVKICANSSLTGNLVLAGGIRLDVNDGGVVSGAGSIKVAANGTLISNTSGNVGGAISAPIVLNSAGLAFAKGTWTGTAYAPSTTFGTTVGGTTGGALSLYSLSGDADVDLSNNSTTGGGAGTLTLTGASTYSGNTTINANTPTAPAVSVVLGVDNALPVTTGLIVGTKTGVGVPVLDLNGKSQQLAYLADGAAVTAAKYLRIVNNSVTSSVLTLGGSVSPGTAFSGNIADGVGAIALVKTGSNTQTLSGYGAYSGGVTVTGGTLRVMPAAGGSTSTALGTGAVVVGGTGQLFVSAGIANAITVNAGGRLSGNGQLDLVTVNVGGVIATNTVPGQLSAATLNVNNTATLAGGGVIEWKVNDASASSGIGYDAFNFNAGLDLASATPANKVVVRVISFAAPGDLAFGDALSMSPGLVHTFNFGFASYVIKPAGVANITDLFTFDVSQFRYSDGTTSAAGLWAMSFDQSTQTMTLTAVPEPSTYGMGLGAVLLAVAAIRRRRQA